MAFLRNLLATIVGLFIFFFLIFFAFAGVVASLESDEVPEVEENSVLYLKMNGVLMERTVEDPLQEIFPSSAPAPRGLMDILKAIKGAKDDPNIRGIYMEHQFIAGGYASLKEIRDALLDFKESGKFIVSYAEYMSENDYYLASAADTIFLHPEGSLEFNGLSANVTFWKGLFDKLDIKPEIFRVGEFKSFVEPFIQKQMSEENRLQLTELLNSVYNTYTTEVSESRPLSKEEIRNISDNLLIHLPRDAVEKGLIDKLGYEDEIKSVIGEKVGEEDLDDIEYISYQKYNKALGVGEYSKNKIAVIVAEGEIVMAGDDNSIVGEKFAEEIRKARENNRIKAIVLRINSPGGSLTASDMIWREINLTRGEKPIIASMSSVAASGGYYLAMGCDTIIAQPNTITGSIGIFGILFNLDDFLENKLGITTDVVRTGKHSDLITLTRELTEYEKEVIQKGVEKGYQTFITKAAEGRGMTKEEIDEVGGGRVWSGVQALENGLIDQVGSFQDAIEVAAKMAEVEDDYRVSFYPRKKPFIEELMGRLSDEADVRIFGGNHALSPYVDDIQELNSMKGIQVRLPAEIRIE